MTDWYDALDYVNQTVTPLFSLKQPQEFSISQAIGNIFRVMMDIYQDPTSTQLQNFANAMIEVYTRIADDIPDSIESAEDIDEAYNAIPISERAGWLDEWLGYVLNVVVREIAGDFSITSSADLYVFSMDPIYRGVRLTIDQAPLPFFEIPYDISTVPQVDIYYGSTKLATLNQGESVTLLTNGKLMSANITCTPTDVYSYSIQYNGSIIHDWSNPITLLTNGKVMAGNVVVEHPLP